VVVHVVGQVLRPGLVRLRQGARVADAISAAGGTRPGADLAAVNLARLVVDGEQIRVTKPGEAPGPGAGPAAGGAPGAAGGAGVSGSSAAPEAPVSLNAADAAALDSLPGVGPVLAQRIIDWRTEHGRFTSVDELAEVSGIGEKIFAQLQSKVTV
jgi:competence protein ComEA